MAHTEVLEFDARPTLKRLADKLTESDHRLSPGAVSGGQWMDARGGVSGGARLRWGLFRFNSRYRLSIDDRLPIFIDGEVTLGLEDTTFNPFIYGQWHFAERHGVGFHWIEPPDP